MSDPITLTEAEREVLRETWDFGPFGGEERQFAAVESIIAARLAEVTGALDYERNVACTSLAVENARLREEMRAFTSTLGFGDGITEPQARLTDMIDPIEQAFSDAGEHHECPIVCELCAETLARTTCERCHGSGCLPNAALAYLECDDCAGAGKIHEGCVEKSYAELATENAGLRATLARVETLAASWYGVHDGLAGDLRAALAGGDS